MKRFVLILLVLIVLLAVLSGRDALVPGRFTGIWYEEQTGQAFLFEEGIIRGCAEPEIFRGAYSFTRSSVTLFVSGSGTLDEVQTLRWDSEKDGAVLRAENGSVCFRRVP